MIAFKGLRSDLTCTMGKGIFQYKEGVWFEESECNIAKNGFHCCENPLDVLSYYGDMERNVYYIVEAAGDITEDGDNKLTCTRIRLLKKLEKMEFLAYAAKYMQEHPDRKWNRLVQKEKGKAFGRDGFVIVRGKHPKAAGSEGALLILLQEESESTEIESIAFIRVGDEGIKPERYYNVHMREVRQRGKEKAVET